MARKWEMLDKWGFIHKYKSVINKLSKVINTRNIPSKWKVNYHLFWSDWHLVKYFYYGRDRHMKLHEYHCNQLQRLGLSHDEIEQYFINEEETAASVNSKNTHSPSVD
ncbi:hypothetical protein ACJ2A9_07945 [Anaerobacillus sp. MEB173]|uniref:hypothetical protein n=1 Tax=Anaerobacillus sp. MEB173 TaxID=3383345 RepID=UPI003F90688F